MSLTFTPLVLLPILATIMTASMLARARKNSDLPETRYFSALVFIGLMLSLLSIADVSLTDLDSKYVVLVLKFVFTPFISVGVFCMMVTHSGRGSWLRLPQVLLISAVSIMAALLSLTSAWHDLFFFDVFVQGTGPYTVKYSNGPLYEFYMYYTYMLLVISAAFLLDSIRRGDRLYRRQGLVLLLAFVPYAVMDLLEGVFDYSTNIDLAPLAIVFTGLVMFWGLYRYRLLDVRPVARDEVIDNMSDALVVVGTDDRLIDFNGITAKLLLEKEARAVGSPLSDVLPFGQQLEDMIARRENKGDITLGGEQAISYEASIMPVMVQGQDRARIVLLRDITDRKRMEEELRTANARLSILSSITRHDLGNKLTAIEGYTILARESKDRGQLDEYLNRVRQVCASANQLIVFAREYEKVGVAAPGWFSLHDLFAHAVAQNNLRDVRAVPNVNGVSVYADAMIEKVLYNLVDNSIRHGKGVTTVSLGTRMDNGSMVIEYTDDGAGVPVENKELIFKRGFGSNTGLGLFLTREILNITGIEIVETGVKGVRFELRVPKGRYRLDT